MIVINKFYYEVIKPMKLIIQELNKLFNDYCKCHNFKIKEQILADINLLSEALTLIQMDSNR